MATETISLQQGIVRKISGSSVAGEFSTIPVIDLAPLSRADSSSEEKTRLVADIRDACRRAGFFIIKNHGINWKVVENALDGLQEFFSLPLEEKMKVHQDRSPSYMGYEQIFYTNVDGLGRGGWSIFHLYPIHVLPCYTQSIKVYELRKEYNITDKKESISIAYNPDIDDNGIDREAIPKLLQRENLWPERSVSPKFQSSVEEYQIACLKLMRKLISIMAVAMGLDKSFFDKKMTYPIASVRCLYYPAQEPQEKNETGLGAHTDIQSE